MNFCLCTNGRLTQVRALETVQGEQRTTCKGKGEEGGRQSAAYRSMQTLFVRAPSTCPSPHAKEEWQERGARK